MVINTPSVGMMGRYTVTPPFIIKVNAIYTCIAVRKFDDIRITGRDVFKLYYEPYDIAIERYKEDVRVGACIITLEDAQGNQVYVPDTYIASMPVRSDIPYNAFVISVSMGALPHFVQMDHVMEKMSEIAGDILGVNADVKLHVRPSRGAVSYEQHEINESARLSAIEQIDTTAAQLRAATEANQQLRAQIAMLSQIIIDHGIVTT